LDTFKNENDVSGMLTKKVKTMSPIDELLSCQRSQQTKTRYLYYVNKFCEHFDTTPQKLLTLKDEAVRTMQKNYLVYLNDKKLSRSYIAGIVSGLDKLLVMTEREDAMLTKKMRDSLIPPSREQKLSGRGAWDEKQIKLMIGSTGNIQTDAILGIFYSTGCRMGAIVENLEGTPKYLRYDEFVVMTHNR
jgi:integrase